MPVIRMDPPYITQINHLRVDPANQDELVAKMTAQLDQHIAPAPGFISSSIHKSLDGRHVVNYVQFETDEQRNAAHDDPGFRESFADYRHLIIEAGPVLYDVVYVRER